MDVSWAEGKPVYANFTAHADGTHRIRVPRGMKIKEMDPRPRGALPQPDQNGRFSLAMRSGQNFHLTFA